MLDNNILDFFSALNIKSHFEPYILITSLILQVDCTANSNVCSKYKVSGYPTLKIFRDGEDSGAYDGPRTAGM